MTTLLRLPFDRETLAAARQAVDAVLVCLGLGPSRATTFLLAIHEVLVNAVDHGGGGGDLTMAHEGDLLVATVEDRVPTTPFELPEDLPPPDMIGHRGLWLATHASHSIRLETGQRGLRVILTFHVTTSSD
jgi:serine/threonine-protein kinase RsbW